MTSARRKRDARGIEALRSVGIPKPERRIDEYSFELSGGLRQRAMIAVALSCDPRLLIADEPTTALDVTTQAQILDLLRKLQQERGMAIMLITHNLGVVAEMADDVVVMYLGRVVEQGNVDDIFHDPKHPYTKALLQSIPSIDSAPKSKLPTISGSIPHPFNRPKGCPFHPRCASVHCRPLRRRGPAASGLSARARQGKLFLYRAMERRTASDRQRRFRKTPRSSMSGDSRSISPSAEGFLQKTVGLVKAVDDVSFLREARRNAVARRRERLRKDDDFPLHPASRQADGRPGSAVGQR